MTGKRRPEPKRPEITELLDLATRLETRLSSNLIDPLCAQLRTAIADSFHGSSHKNSSLSVKYDESAVRIWNTSLRSDAVSITKALPLLRAFSLSLLRTAHRCAGDTSSAKNDSIIRLLCTSLRVAKTCIDGSEFDLATDTLQNAADYVAFFADSGLSPRNIDHDPARLSARDLITQYWLLRSTLSWKQDRLDLTETHFAKVMHSTDLTNPSTKVKVADLAYEIGRDVFKRPTGGDCIAWFEQASKALECISEDEVSPEVMELRLSITRDLTRALIKEQTEESRSRAADLISYLEKEQGRKLGTLLLKVDLLNSKGQPEPGEYQAVISQMINTAVLSDATFRTILDHIRKLHSLSALLARETLQTFLSIRLFEYDEKVFIEKAVVMYMWIASTEAARGESVCVLHRLLDDTLDAVHTPFSDEATHAAQTLCWKSIEAAIHTKAHLVAEQWCCAASHALFVNAGDGNKIKIARKLMMVAMLDGRTSVAREAYYQMPQFGREAAPSQYLLYRVALSDGDDTLVNECLGKLVRAHDTDAELLYACAQEAQQHNSRDYALKALHTILQRADSATLKGVKVPTLVRCMVQMLLKEIEDKTGDMVDQLSDIRRLLKSATSSVDLSADGDKGRSELEWFAKTSYNIAIKYMTDSEPSETLAVIDACISFARALRAVPAERDREPTCRRLMTCHFIGASACVILARSDDHSLSSEQFYAEALKHTAGFAETAPDVVVTSDQDKSSLAYKRSQMLRLEIEALYRLKQFDKLDKVLQICTDVEGGEHLDTLADLVISIHSVMLDQQIDPKYHQRIPAVMENIVNRSWRRDKANIPKLARWLRCIFRMTSTTSPETALRILDQAASLAGDHGLVRESHRYPAAELEWLASTAFNTAVDRLCASDHEGCRTWAEAALNLARVSTDSPRLYAQMQGLWMRLQDQQLE